MFDVIRKKEYWNALNEKALFERIGGDQRKQDGLKHIQDVWMLQRLMSLRDAKVIEIGGGASRVLPALDESNERWNLDELAGVGSGPTKVPDMPSVKLVRRRMGDFAAELADGYFDVAFSISVMEHVPADALEAFWRDQARVIKPGGLSVHAIDVYVGDELISTLQKRVELYENLWSQAGFVPVDAKRLPSPLVFRCDMASHSDWGMWKWNTTAPSIAEMRERTQAVTLGVVLKRAG